MKNKKVILIFIGVILLCSLVPFVLNKNAIQRKIQIAEEEKAEQEKYEKTLKDDEIAPVLILTQDKVTMYKGDELNYLAFVREASDNLEGDITSKVKYKELDINKVGEYYIDYEVSDKASNVTKARLLVIIKEKPNFKY